MSFPGTIMHYAIACIILSAVQAGWHMFKWWWRPPIDPTSEQVKKVRTHFEKHFGTKRYVFPASSATDHIVKEVLTAAIHEGWKPPA